MIHRLSLNEGSNYTMRTKSSSINDRQRSGSAIHSYKSNPELKSITQKVVENYRYSSQPQYQSLSRRSLQVPSDNGFAYHRYNLFKSHSSGSTQSLHGGFVSKDDREDPEDELGPTISKRPNKYDQQLYSYAAQKSRRPSYRYTLNGPIPESPTTVTNTAAASVETSTRSSTAGVTAPASGGNRSNMKIASRPSPSPKLPKPIIKRPSSKLRAKLQLDKSLPDLPSLDQPSSNSPDAPSLEYPGHSATPSPESVGFSEEPEGYMKKIIPAASSPLIHINQNSPNLYMFENMSDFETFTKTFSQAPADIIYDYDPRASMFEFQLGPGKLPGVPISPPKKKVRQKKKPKTSSLKTKSSKGISSKTPEDGSIKTSKLQDAASQSIHFSQDVQENDLQHQRQLDNEPQHQEQLNIHLQLSEKLEIDLPTHEQFLNNESLQEQLEDDSQPEELLENEKDQSSDQTCDHTSVNTMNSDAISTRRSLKKAERDKQREFELQQYLAAAADSSVYTTKPLRVSSIKSNMSRNNSVKIPVSASISAKDQLQAILSSHGLTRNSVGSHNFDLRSQLSLSTPVPLNTNTSLPEDEYVSSSPTASELPVPPLAASRLSVSPSFSARIKRFSQSPQFFGTETFDHNATAGRMESNFLPELQLHSSALIDTLSPFSEESSPPTAPSPPPAIPPRSSSRVFLSSDRMSLLNSPSASFRESIYKISLPNRSSIISGKSHFSHQSRPSTLSLCRSVSHESLISRISVPSVIVSTHKSGSCSNLAELPLSATEDSDLETPHTDKEPVEVSALDSIVQDFISNDLSMLDTNFDSFDQSLNYSLSSLSTLKSETSSQYLPALRTNVEILSCNPSQITLNRDSFYTAESPSAQSFGGSYVFASAMNSPVTPHHDSFLSSAKSSKASPSSWFSPRSPHEYTTKAPTLAAVVSRGSESSSPTTPEEEVILQQSAEKSPSVATTPKSPLFENPHPLPGTMKELPVEPELPAIEAVDPTRPRKRISMTSKLKLFGRRVKSNGSHTNMATISDK